jgi:hypothetical protein
LDASDLITDFVTDSDIFDFSTIDANASKGGPLLSAVKTQALLPTA